MDLPWEIDTQRSLDEPFLFEKFYSTLSNGKHDVFAGQNQMQVTVAVDCAIDENPEGINQWIYVIVSISCSLP